MAKIELKKPVVEEISKNIEGAAAVVVVNYSGITVAQDTALRKELREAGVIYKVYKTNGEMIELTNPSNLPDPSEIEYMEEPVVSAEIMVTSEYIGAIMDLCQERRGVYVSMEYIEETSQDRQRAMQLAKWWAI